MKQKRWKLQICFFGSFDWDIEEEYAQITVCIADAEQLKDDTVKAMFIVDNANGLRTEL